MTPIRRGTAARLGLRAPQPPWATRPHFGVPLTAEQIADIERRWLENHGLKTWLTIAAEVLPARCVVAVGKPARGMLAESMRYVPQDSR